jgi:hypothetical protein
LVACGGGGVFLSTNNGASWTAVNNGLTSQYVESLTVSGSNLFAGTYGGVFLSTNNGASWTAVNTGLTNLTVRSLTVSGTNLFAGTNGGGVFFSANNGASWTAVNAGLTGFVNRIINSLQVSGSNLFAGTYGGTWSRPLSEFDVQVAPPTTTSFTPTSGAVGTSVTITGTNFDPTPANNVVIFGATSATVTAATSTQLNVTVPIGATYAPITVLNTTTGLLAYSKSNFTPTFSPTKGSITTADFTPKVDFTTGTNPLSVAVGDLDGDGKADMAVANLQSNTVSVYRNTSSSGSIYQRY